jgi:hypothetical protein
VKAIKVSLAISTRNGWVDAGDSATLRWHIDRTSGEFLMWYGMQCTISIAPSVQRATAPTLQPSLRIVTDKLLCNMARKSVPLPTAMTISNKD